MPYLYPHRSLVQPMPDGDDHRLRAVRYIQLGEDSADMVAHGPLREVQLAGNFGVAQAACHPAQQI